MTRGDMDYYCNRGSFKIKDLKENSVTAWIHSAPWVCSLSFSQLLSNSWICEPYRLTLCDGNKSAPRREEQSSGVGNCMSLQVMIMPSREGVSKTRPDRVISLTIGHQPAHFLSLSSFNYLTLELL